MDCEIVSCANWLAAKHCRENYSGQGDAVNDHEAVETAGPSTSTFEAYQGEA